MLAMNIANTLAITNMRPCQVVNVSFQGSHVHSLFGDISIIIIPFLDFKHEQPVI